MTAWIRDRKALLNLNENQMEVPVFYWLLRLRMKQLDYVAHCPIVSRADSYAFLISWDLAQ
jgi:hypothetical protein